MPGAFSPKHQNSLVVSGGNDFVKGTLIHACFFCDRLTIFASHCKSQLLKLSKTFSHFCSRRNLDATSPLIVDMILTKFKSIPSITWHTKPCVSSLTSGMSMPAFASMIEESLSINISYSRKSSMDCAGESLITRPNKSCWTMVIFRDPPEQEQTAALIGRIEVLDGVLQHPLVVWVWFKRNNLGI